MAEYQVLGSEPRHEVDAFVNELLGRARLVITEMGAELERLLRQMIGQFHTFREHHYLITLRDVRFEWIRWVKEGLLVIEFSADHNAAHAPDSPELRHVVIDEFVDGVVGRTVPEDLRGEFSQFVRGMVNQFSALRKHSATNLTQIKFGDIRWLDDRHLAIQMTYQGRPFGPRTVGL